MCSSAGPVPSGAAAHNNQWKASTLRLQAKIKMQPRRRPIAVRDRLSLAPSPSDKLSSRLRGLDRPNCFNHKELPFESVGIADALPTRVGPTPERRANL